MVVLLQNPNSLRSVARCDSDLKFISHSVYDKNDKTTECQRLPQRAAHTTRDNDVFDALRDGTRSSVCNVCSVYVAEKAKKIEGDARRNMEKRQKLTRLFHLGSECCTGWRWWRNNMPRPFIKFILSHQKILEALQLIFTAKTAA